MTDFLHQLRRSATQLVIQQTISATRAVPIGSRHFVVRSLVTQAHRVPALRQRVLDNMHLALGNDVPPQAARLYFHCLGWHFSSALSTFHHGVMATPLPGEVKLDESIRLLDEAVAEGRGVVLASAHWTGYELVAAIVNRRHPMTMLVRQAPTSERMVRKVKWYKALGTEIVLRPIEASAIKDAVAYLSVLKRGKVLTITPDLLADPGQGYEAKIFGRQARLRGGAFALAIAAKAPMIRMSLRWNSDMTPVAVFDRAALTVDRHDRDAAIRAGVQDWCRWFEDKLKAHPENWLFWLDKRWSRFLRTTPRDTGAK